MATVEYSPVKAHFDKYHKILKSLADELPQSNDWIQLFPADAEGPGEERIQMYGRWVAAHKLAKQILSSLDTFFSKHGARTQKLLEYRRELEKVKTEFDTQLPMIAKKLETWIYNTYKQKNPWVYAKSWFQKTPYLDFFLVQQPQKPVITMTDYPEACVMKICVNGELISSFQGKQSTHTINGVLVKIEDERTSALYEILEDGTTRDLQAEEDHKD